MGCKKKGCHKVCLTCLVAYHNHCGHACPSAAPASQHPPATSPNPLAARAQPPSNEEAPVPPPDNDPPLAPQPISYAARARKYDHRIPLLVNADAERKFVALCTVSRVRFQRVRGCSITLLPKHEAWAHAPPPQPSIFGSIERCMVNEDNKWYTLTSQLDALSEWCARSAPQTVPPLKFDPSEGLFVIDRGDKGLTTDISRSVQCKICKARMPHVYMCTHVGQHLLRKQCVKGHEEISLATACGFCGDHVTCSTQTLMCNKRTHALVTLVLSDCLSQPGKLPWNPLPKNSASSRCTDHPIRCPLCPRTVWSYCMAQHYAYVHDTAAPRFDADCGCRARGSAKLGASQGKGTKIGQFAG